MKYILLPLLWLCRGMDWLATELNRTEKYWDKRKREKFWDDPPF
jgi:hypothetical protein